MLVLSPEHVSVVVILDHKLLDRRLCDEHASPGRSSEDLSWKFADLECSFETSRSIPRKGSQKGVDENVVSLHIARGRGPSRGPRAGRKRSLQHEAFFGQAPPFAFAFLRTIQRSNVDLHQLNIVARTKEEGALQGGRVLDESVPGAADLLGE